jgi:hypothetical protein
MDLQPSGAVVMKQKPNKKIQNIMKEAGMLKNVDELNKYQDIKKTMSDAEGLSKAYKQPDHIFVNDNKMYVAGSKSVSDWRDNFMFIPQKMTRFHNIYKSVDQALKENPQVNHLVGHSAGGSSVLEIQKRYPEKEFKTTTYNAPVFSLSNETPNNDNLRFTSQKDAVNVFDRGGINIYNKSINPLTQHSYNNFGDQGSNIGRLIM